MQRCTFVIQFQIPAYKGLYPWLQQPQLHQRLHTIELKVKQSPTCATPPVVKPYIATNQPFARPMLIYVDLNMWCMQRKEATNGLNLGDVGFFVWTTTGCTITKPWMSCAGMVCKRVPFDAWICWTRTASIQCKTQCWINVNIAFVCTRMQEHFTFNLIRTRKGVSLLMLWKTKSFVATREI